MNKAYCKKLFDECVRFRDKWCVLTGEPKAEVHHMIFESQGCWELQFDTDYAVLLCAECHRGKPYSPHTDNVAFINKLEPFIEDEVRRQKIIASLTMAVPVLRDLPDYDEIGRRLTIQRAELKEQFEMDYDCCPREIWK